MKIYDKNQFLNNSKYEIIDFFGTESVFDQKYTKKVDEIDKLLDDLMSDKSIIKTKSGLIIKEQYIKYWTDIKLDKDKRIAKHILRVVDKKTRDKFNEIYCKKEFIIDDKEYSAVDIFLNRYNNIEFSLSKDSFTFYCF